MLGMLGVRASRQVTAHDDDVIIFECVSDLVVAVANGWNAWECLFGEFTPPKSNESLQKENRGLLGLKSMARARPLANP